MMGDVEDSWTRSLRRLWAWPVAVIVGLPIAGYLADLVVDGVDSLGAAVLGGLIAGVVIGAAEWLALRRWVSWLWIPATGLGMTIGLVVGAALVDYSVDRGDLMLMGAVTGLGVGVLQAVVLGRPVSRAAWWAVANPPAWALGWLVTTYVIAANVKEHFAVFGASGALVFGVLTWLLLAALLRGSARRPGR
jgi:hypothetical protein